MSYDIIYNKQFVKLRKTGEVIPMLLAGPSNCFDIGRNGRTGRRSRSWANDRFYNRKGKLSEKPEIILKNLDAELRRQIRNHRKQEEPVKPADIREHWGYYVAIVVGSGHCADTSWDLYRSQYANGIKNAMTIEQLDSLGVNLHFEAFEDGDRPDTISIKTEREYFAELKKWREWQEKTGHRPYLSFYPVGSDSVLERLRAIRRKVARTKERVEQEHYFVLSGPSGNLVKYTSRGFQYSYSSTGGRKFRTEQEAEKRRKELVKKGRYKADTWKVKRIDQPATFWV